MNSKYIYFRKVTILDISLNTYNPQLYLTFDDGKCAMKQTSGNQTSTIDAKNLNRFDKNKNTSQNVNNCNNFRLSFDAILLMFIFPFLFCSSQQRVDSMFFFYCLIATAPVKTPNQSTSVPQRQICSSFYLFNDTNLRFSHFWKSSV